MKASFVSSSAVSNAMRYQLMRMQADLVKGQKEVSTGRVADPGLTLGARTSQSVSLSRDLERLNGIIDSNGLVKSRLAATQNALGQIASAAQTFFGTLTAASSGDASATVTSTDAKSTLNALTSILNSSLNGEHLFAGINTDVKPLNDFAAAGSPNKTAFDAAFQTHFGFTQSDPAAANITKAQMDNFLTAVVEPQFLGAGWQTNWSSATDQKIVSRIALNETAETSVSANNEGMRKLAMAAATISGLFTSQMSGDAKKAVVDRSLALVGEAIASIGTERSQAGIAENRVKSASDRIAMQVDLFERNILDMEGVDPYEASNRVASLLSQIETSYALTARIQQLSLLKFL
jgi:flagellar hook-associated protein 3 FlgL